MKEEEDEKGDDKERQTFGRKGKTKQDSKLKKTRIEIPGLY
jgi:hypothetical protein